MTSSNLPDWRERDVAWLNGLRDKGHCGEGTLERNARARLDERIDRIIALLSVEGGLGISSSASGAACGLTASTDPLDFAKLEEEVRNLVFTAELVGSNIEEFPNWIDYAPLVTAHAHGSVLAADIGPTVLRLIELARVRSTK